MYEKPPCSTTQNPTLMKARNNLLATVLALAVPLCTWAQTESEPNDDIANANTITLGTAMSGDMGPVPCSSGANVDYFMLNLTADGQLNINTAADNSSGSNSNIRVDLYNSDGAQLTWFNHVSGPQGAPNNATTTVNCLNKGTYYLRLQGSSASLCYTYALTLTLTAPVFADDAEPNNTPAQADVYGALAPATVTEGHVNFSHYVDNSDYYRIETPGDGTLNITLNSEAVGAGHLRVDVYNDNGNQLHWDNYAVGTGGTPNSVTKSYTCDAQGVYYLEVRSTAVCGASYQLSYTITAPLFANDTEPNNTPAQADANPVLPPATVTEGHVNFSHYGDNSDYYRIETPGDGVLNITLNSEAAAAGSLRIDVYNDVGAQLHWNNYVTGTGGTPNSVTQSYTCDAQGVYYLEVHSNGVCGASYELSYTVTPPFFGNDAEPNGTTATAIAFNPDSAQAEGHLNFSHYVENNDHYKVILPVAGAITFDLEAEAAVAGILRINLLNEVGTLITWNNYTTGGGGIPAGSLVNFTGLAAGTYYLELYATNVCGVSYRLHCNDADDDGVCNYFDLCPGTPNGEGVNGDGCACSQLTVDDGDPCTLDQCTNGIVTHTFQDADGDLTCDAQDGCPNDPNKIAPGACGCGNPDVPTTWYADTDGDGFGDPNESQAGFTCSQPGGYVANNTDLCPSDINKQNPGACGCGVADTDTDNDGIADCNDNCPNLAGVQGDACDDLDANTTGDVIDANCECHGTPQGGCVQNEVILSIHGDGVSNVGWTLYDQGGNTVASGGQVYPNGDHAQTLCLADGCYRLAVTDGEGDGILGGGYLLTTAAGQRIIDNTANFSSGSLSAISGNQTFCLPIGSDKPIFASCDKLDWVNNKFIVATANPTVSAQYGVTNTTSGYEFWFYDPNGSYSFRRFRSHATSDGYGSGALRACHFKVNGWTNSMATPHLPANILLNVRVRGRVAGNNLAFGPACQFKIDAALAACPRVKLQDDPANTSDYSCGVSREFGGASRPANRIYANPPQPVPAVASSNVRYQFRFRIAGEGICIVRPPQKSAQLVLNWTNGTPLQCSKTYAVDVRVSLNGGATWCFGPGSSSQAAACADTDDWGKVCEVTINCQEMDGGNNSMALMGDGVFTLYPNPNHGDQLFLNVTNVQQGVNTVNVDMYDLSGKRVWARTIAVQDGFVKTNLDLNGDLAGGMYMVHITAGDKAYTERLVIQP
ncbi:MAG: T9SS type A sorting domain-containing protein [Flavobacteriales bacterium]|nr:MAG: T9SS type A sorting domain-containing protein [Flavobacteriales bacterium]